MKPNMSFDHKSMVGSMSSLVQYIRAGKMDLHGS